ncbi:MAG TPA: hypothetical protein RMH99_01665, partial [Sandaracinaceae bacterium LLY-WYZ-13_1]|nr:hypothetical protein [Sandaracinaceae bacterium LLY-WYZ-13_1]
MERRPMRAPASGERGREDDAPPTIRIHVVSGWVDAGFDADAAGTTEVVLESRVDGTSAIVGA